MNRRTNFRSEDFLQRGGANYSFRNHFHHRFYRMTINLTEIIKNFITSTVLKILNWNFKHSFLPSQHTFLGYFVFHKSPSLTQCLVLKSLAFLVQLVFKNNFVLFSVSIRTNGDINARQVSFVWFWVKLRFKNRIKNLLFSYFLQPRCVLSFPLFPSCLCIAGWKNVNKPTNVTSAVRATPRDLLKTRIWIMRCEV